MLETVRPDLSMPIDLLERAIGVVDAAALPADEDPWLYFYEDFLGAYDPALRKSRGVYYTPVEVVRAQVRFASGLLRERFGKAEGFAGDGVVVLDPACGTSWASPTATPSSTSPTRWSRRTSSPASRIPRSTSR